MSLLSRLSFELGAGIYDLITAQETWRRHCREMAPLVPGERVLDLGIGPGVSGIELARAAPERRFFGLDLSAAMLARARAHAAAAGVTLPLVRGDALRLPFHDAAFDAATGHSFLYLLPDSDQALREVSRVVRPGGRIAFLEPRDGGTFSPHLLRNGWRFAASMALWRVYSRLHGRYGEASAASQLLRCGFTQPAAAPALDGLGLVLTARRP